jgi:N-acetyl-gamma-glutamyl-phosphate reductase
VKALKVAIVGVTGYTGIELIRLIQLHPELEIGTIHSHTIHEEVTAVYPHLQQLINQEIQPFDPVQIMAENELVFFATPAGISKDLVAVFVEENFPVVDLSGDLRLKSGSEYQKWYQQKPATPAILQQAIYALPEFQTTPGNLLSNPGCYATAAILAAAPLVKKKLFMGIPIFDGKSGLSGAGKKLTETSHFVTISENMLTYKLNQHQHIPEILQQFKQWDSSVSAIQFSTSLIPVKRGLMMTLYGTVAATTTVEEIYQLYLNEYQEKPFVRIQPLGKLPEIRQVTGTNFCDIGLVLNPETHIVTVIAVIDNLVKGAAGQSIQNVNKWAGWEETTGLLQVPCYP